MLSEDTSPRTKGRRRNNDMHQYHAYYELNSKRYLHPDRTLGNIMYSRGTWGCRTLSNKRSSKSEARSLKLAPQHRSTAIDATWCVPRGARSVAKVSHLSAKLYDKNSPTHRRSMAPDTLTN
jgi:hypothetical protein